MRWPVAPDLLLLRGEGIEKEDELTKKVMASRGPALKQYRTKVAATSLSVFEY